MQWLPYMDDTHLFYVHAWPVHAPTVFFVLVPTTMSVDDDTRLLQVHLESPCSIQFITIFLDGLPIFYTPATHFCTSKVGSSAKCTQQKMCLIK